MICLMKWLWAWVWILSREALRTLPGHTARVHQTLAIFTTLHQHIWIGLILNSFEWTQIAHASPHPTCCGPSEFCQPILPFPTVTPHLASTKCPKEKKHTLFLCQTHILPQIIQRTKHSEKVCTLPQTPPFSLIPMGAHFRIGGERDLGPRKQSLYVNKPGSLLQKTLRDWLTKCTGSLLSDTTKYLLQDNFLWRQAAFSFHLMFNRGWGAEGKWVEGRG